MNFIIFNSDWILWQFQLSHWCLEPAPPESPESEVIVPFFIFCQRNCLRKWSSKCNVRFVSMWTSILYSRATKQPLQLKVNEILFFSFRYMRAWECQAKFQIPWHYWLDGPYLSLYCLFELGEHPFLVASDVDPTLTNAEPHQPSENSQINLAVKLRKSTLDVK